MATTNARLILDSLDLLTDNLSIDTSSTLTTAGATTGLTQTTGLARKTISAGSAAALVHETLYRAGDYTADKANKIYIKNTSTTTTEFFTIRIGDEELGRIYAGDWCFFPWSATAGTKETFVVTIADTWAAGDTYELDGITTTAANSTVNDIAAQISAQVYPNWTTTVSGAAVTIVARYGSSDGVSTGDTAITGDTVTTAGDGSAAVSGGTAGAGALSPSDITVKASVHTGMTLEYMLFYE